MNNDGRPIKPKQNSGEIKTILLVEDDGFHLELMVRSLSVLADKFRVITALNFKKAQRLINEIKPHMVISDLQLPDGSGLDFLSHNHNSYQFAVVVITSRGNEDTAVQAMKAGALDYIVKSEQAFDELPRIVVRTVREWETQCQRNEALQALFRSEERFRAIFESTTDFMGIKDSQLVYSHVNPAMAELLEMDPEQMIGLTDVELYGPDVAKVTTEWDTRALAGHTVEEQQVREINGQSFVFIDTRTPIRDSEGNIVSLAVISRDITQRLGEQKSSNVSQDMVSSQAMRSTMQMVEQVAESNSTILFLGESGSGKDYLARWVHDHSLRSTGPFFSVDCATIGEHLAESVLFGHERGAFTGAVARKKGLVELAEGGTLLLNEIGELPPQLQSKLLTFLDTKSFVRLGGEVQHKVNVRLLAATHRDLKKEVEEQRFLSPLYYRLNVITVQVPSLRERKEDLPALIEYLINQIGSQLHLTQIPAVTESDIQAALSYEWPGNVRELKNIIERSLILWKDGSFRLLVPEEGVKAEDESPDSSTMPPNLTIQEAVNQLKRSMTIQALQNAGGAKTEAARILGVSRDAIYRYIKEYDIKDSEF